MNIPNLLTLLRLLLIPVFIYTFYNNTENHLLIPLIVLLFAGFTDILDGYIARKFNMVTKWGKLLDPLVDKIFQLSVLFVVTERGLIPIWMIIVVFLKEIFLIIGSSILYKRNVVAKANWYGKVGTVLFYIAIALVIFVDGLIGVYATAFAVLWTIYAALRYTYDYTRISS